MRLVHWPALLALIPLVAIGVVLLRRGFGPQTGRDLAAWVLTGLACLLVVLGLSEPRIGNSARGPAVLAVDNSASIDSHEVAQERKILKGVGATDCHAPCRIIRFAGDANASPGTGTAGTGERSQTNLQDGIAAAIGLAPAGGRVVVMSDGAQTTGSLLVDVPLARERRVQVNWVRLDPSDKPDVAITSLNLPSAVHLGDSVPVAVTVHSTTTGFALLKVSSDGAATRGQTIRVLRGDNPLVLLYTAARRGWHSFKATVSEPNDTDRRDNSLSAVTDVLAAPRVLAVTAPGAASAVPGMLTKLGMRVQTVAADQLPTDASGYLGDDAVVLDDGPATSLSRTRALALDAAVSSDGLGMLVLGGPHSFSLGRYATSPIQTVLPVRSLVPGNLQRRNVAIELVLDRSGSMVDKAGGVAKIAMARQAARQTAGFIATHDDQLGIVDFDIVPHTLVPLERLNATVRNSVDKTVAGLQADGGTNIYLGLKAGYAQLVHSTAQERHIILMTDGISQPENYGPLLTKLRAAHISVATVALGTDADRSLLAQIATATGGHAYVTDNAHDLPKVFAKETQLSAKPVRVRGKLSVSLDSDSTVVRSLLGKALPKVLGNVVVTTKPGAQTDLVASGEKSTTNPALAEWQVGAGRVVTWTPGLGSPWGTAWLSQTSLWNDAVRWSGRGVQVPSLTPVADPASSGELEINLATAGTAALGTNGISGTLRSSSGKLFTIRFAPDGPATYTAQVPGLTAGVYAFALTSTGRSPTTSTGDVAVPYPSEFSPATAGVSPMGELVQQTGGEAVDPAKIGALLGGGHSLEQLLTLLALLCFLAGLLVRFLPARSPRSRSGSPEVTAEARRDRVA